ncbi:MAG: tolB protein precursor, periplasmic protein involved in the tonb-independent uptake of group A colicins [uncultured Sphingomonadaceae bacterium]|uniref:TolB protein, periplasmic protein involved in the tonb-independent uptake of group A colicins n=1 Tax=uncultured Sphingomonadaceae bacterium TaxID=169976 RepID=A0A6J4RUK6_9SPHN|nr:MAG: tolB protein precursor, periplasmic protein involved in the tonb-independent uptake of group A colicins [uncultured Sphingomonadaceae bacterium]
MKHRTVAAASLLALAAHNAAAQTPTPPQPVEETQAPEDEVLRPDDTPDPLPAPSPAPAAAAQPAAPTPAPTPPKWDVNAPTGARVRQVPIRTSEGSWMDLDVSRDGRTIAFSLLGDVYTMPIEGGTPRRIAEGLAWEVQPRFSPDGRRIAFTSDRGGGDNIWVMNRDGSDKRQVTTEEFRLLNQPSWSPDGRFIVAKKHFTTGRSLGTGEVWMYHVSGGAGVLLVKRPSEVHQKELGEPIFAADGKSVFFTRNITPGPIFEYAQDSNTELFNIERYELETGETTPAVTGEGGAVRPTPSPDGRRIAFVRREGTRSKLYVKDLADGTERKIYDALDQDVQETWAVTGVYPNMAWTPDARSILFWAGGKLRRVDADGSNAREIPFRIDDTRGVIDAPHPQIAVAPDRFTARMTRFPAVSPDGRQVVYESLGKLWLKPVGGGAPRRLTRSTQAEGFELFPTWSRDGRTVAFVQWTDEGLGRIRSVGANGGAARDVTSVPGHYARPRFSPDGTTIVFERGRGGGLTSSRYSDDPGVYRVAARGGAPVRVARGLAAPHFGASSDRLFMVEDASEGGKSKRQLVSTDLSGADKRVHASGELATDFFVSPDGRHVAFRQNYEAFVVPLMPGTQAVELDPAGKALPVVRVSTGGADYIHWSNAGARLHWAVGSTLNTAQTAALFPDAPRPKGATAPPVRPTTTSLAYEQAAAKPRGVVALVGARLVTMAGDDAAGGVIEDGVVIIRGDRIAAVGPRGSTPAAAGATVIDVAGKTIIPGLIDAHAHGPAGADELIPQANWSMIQNLAMGTTTVHDPSNRASEIFAAAEMQRAGLILAPRIFSTGEIVYGAKAADVYAEINGLDDALAHVRRLRAQGAHSVKNYNQPRREQRQQVVEAARREGMQVVAEGGSLFGMDMNLIADGNSTLEHNVPLNVFYDDVLQFWSQSSTYYTPTLVVTYGGLAGDPYWRQAVDWFDHPLLRAHTPPARLLADTARRVKAPESNFVDDDSAREARKLAQRGVPVSIGAHGQQAGAAAHWELWSFVRGGMTPVEALRTGTVTAARSLGMARDIGSIEQGKLADLVVLDADPTQDIRNTDDVSRVMLGGRLYDARTMNEVATGTARRPAYWWEGR